MASSRDKRPSEFGGVPGRIAPAPHELSNVEQLRLERSTDPMDVTASAENALLKEWAEEGRL